jgi:hypothetical protein
MAGDFETITVSSSPIGFTASKLNPTTGYFAGRKAERVECSLEGNPIRFQKHLVANQNLAAGVGHPKNVLDEWAEKGHATLFNYRMIAQGADGTVSVTFYYQV